MVLWRHAFAFPFWGVSADFQGRYICVLGMVNVQKVPGTTLDSSNPAPYKAFRQKTSMSLLMAS